MTFVMPLIGRLVDKVGARAIILVGLPFLALTTWQLSALDIDTGDMTLRLWLAARGCAMGVVMMPSMTAGLNAIPLAKMSRGSSMSNVMRQVFSAFGTAIVVTILEQRQAFHTATLSQLVTQTNIPLQQVLASAQAWALGHGMSAGQAQMMGVMMVARQVATTAAVMSYDDVFRITAAVTLLALLPAVFLKTNRSAREPRAVCHGGLTGLRISEMDHFALFRSEPLTAISGVWNEWRRTRAIEDALGKVA